MTLQAVLRTVPIPAACGVMLLSFAGLLDAAAFVNEILVPELGATSCDLFDRRALSLARDADASFHGWIDESAEAVLTIEFEGQEIDSIAARLRNVRRDGGPDGSTRLRAVRHASSEPNAIDSWACGSWSSRCSCGLADVPGRSRSSTTWRCRPTSSSAVLQRLQGLLQQQNVTWTLDACAGSGRLRLRPFLDLSDPGDRAKLEPLAAGVYDIVLAAGGTIGSSQACGLARTQFLRKQYGELLQVFREIKDAFDPLGQLNPGKVIGDDPHLMLRNLRPWSSVPAKPTPPLEPNDTKLLGKRRDPHGPARRGRSRERLVVRARSASERAGFDGRVHPTGLALAGPLDDRDGVELPGLRHLPLARPDDADVPELSRLAARSGGSPRPGKPDPRRRHRPGRPAALGQR